MVRQKGGNPGREKSGDWGTDWEGVQLESMGDAAQKAQRPARKCTKLGKKRSDGGDEARLQRAVKGKYRNFQQ